MKANGIRRRHETGQEIETMVRGKDCRCVVLFVLLGLCFDEERSTVNLVREAGERHVVCTLARGVFFFFFSTGCSSCISSRSLENVADK